MKHDNSKILIISDMHIPYQHPDTVAFLRAIKKKYKPTRVICVGDEIDAHAMSFHDSDPDLPSAGDELQAAIKTLKPIYKIFPQMDLVDSNHGSMVYRKGKHHGIPRKYLREYGEVLEAPKTGNGTLHSQLIFQTAKRCLFVMVCKNVDLNWQRQWVCVRFKDIITPSLISNTAPLQVSYSGVFRLDALLTTKPSHFTTTR